MSWGQVLQVLGVGEGRGRVAVPPPAAPQPPQPAPRPSGPTRYGRPAVTDFERAQMARLPGPKPVQPLDGSVAHEYAMAMAGADGSADQITGGAAFTGEPTVSIRTAAVRPVVMFSRYKPPSGGAKDQQGNDL